MKASKKAIVISILDLYQVEYLNVWIVVQIISSFVRGFESSLIADYH